MEVSGQLHAPAALPPPPRKELTVSIWQEAGWTLESIWTLWRREKSCTAENRTLALHPVARRYTHWAIPTANNDISDLIHGHTKTESSTFTLNVSALR
jgi:hypothetical protein